jgi:hypothetical protein
MGISIQETKFKMIYRSPKSMIALLFGIATKNKLLIHLQEEIKAVV